MTEVLHCSFCNKSQDAVEKLIAAPKERGEIYICNECVRVCVEILDGDNAKPPELPEDPPRRLPTWLVRMLGPEVEKEQRDSPGTKAPSE